MSRSSTCVSKQIDFSEDISENIYERMRTERHRVAAELRAQG